jgi:AraC family transcriptional activator of tynA and feaB
METSRLSEAPALVDLSTVEEALRAKTWSGAATTLFPGLAVKSSSVGPPAGNIRRVQMGGGSLWAIRSSPAVVDYAPSNGSEAYFTLMLQIEGSSRLGQRARSGELGEGDIVLLDERLPFRLEALTFGNIALLRMPRQIVLGRNPHLEHITATPLRAAEAGTSLVGDTLTSAIHTVPFMQDNQRSSVMTAIIHLLGAMDPSIPETLPSWRVQAALAFIEQNFSTPGLKADEVAQSQRISRRRLDQLLLEAVGVSITAHIWSRRLEQAAADLRDPACARRTASDTGYANGFEDPAHFTRAFRRRYGYSPLQWRNLVELAN